MGKTTLRIGFMNAENLFSPGVTFYKSKYTKKQYREDRLIEREASKSKMSENGQHWNAAVIAIVLFVASFVGLLARAIHYWIRWSLREEENHNVPC